MIKNFETKTQEIMTEGIKVSKWEGGVPEAAGYGARASGSGSEEARSTRNSWLKILDAAPTIPHCTQRNTTQHNAAQRNTTQHNAAAVQAEGDQETQVQARECARRFKHSPDSRVAPAAVIDDGITTHL